MKQANHSWLRCLFAGPKPAALSFQKPAQGTPAGPGAYLHARRAKLGQTQAQAAYALGISAGTYSQWETSAYEPRPRQWPAILRYLGFDPVCPTPTNPAEKVAFLIRHAGLTLTELGGQMDADRHTLANVGSGIQLRKRLAARLDAWVAHYSTRQASAQKFSACTLF